MGCKHSYYNNSNDKDILFCEMTKNPCAFQRYCPKFNKIILSENWRICKLANKKILPKGAYEVLFEKRDFLYIELEDKTIKLRNTVGSVPEFVYLKDGIEGYEMSLTPFEVKKVYAKKKTESIKLDEEEKE